MATANSHSHNVEALTLLQSLNTLTTAVSGDLLRVANRLTEEELISLEQLEESQLQTKTSRVRANELVRRVIYTTNLRPEKFIVFLDILEESSLFRNVVKDMYKKYETKSKGLYTRPPLHAMNSTKEGRQASNGDLKHDCEPPKQNGTQDKDTGTMVAPNLNPSGNQLGEREHPQKRQYIHGFPLSPWVMVLLTTVLSLVGIHYLAMETEVYQIYLSTLVKITITSSVIATVSLLFPGMLSNLLEKFETFVPIIF